METNNYSPLKMLLGTAVTAACIISVAARPASTGTVTGVNGSFHNIPYNDKHVSENGKAPSFGNLPANTDRDRSLNVIASRNFLTGLTRLSPAELTEAAEPESVPERGTIVGLLILGTTFLVRCRDRQASES
jgi:hypothetical protein